MDLTEYLSIQTGLRASMLLPSCQLGVSSPSLTWVTTVGENHYVDGRRSKASLDDEASDVVAGYKDWVSPKQHARCDFARAPNDHFRLTKSLRTQITRRQDRHTQALGISI